MLVLQGEKGGAQSANTYRFFLLQRACQPVSTRATYLAKVGAERLGVCPQLVGRVAIQQSL